MSDVAGLLAAHPRLRAVMRDSPTFREIKTRAVLEIDGETLYIVRGDALGDEQELFIDALARGAASKEDDACRRLFLELDEDSRKLIEARVAID